MAGPTVNIKILADAAQATKTLDTASGKVGKFGGSMKSAALPIAAAGVALFSMGKSAVEDAAGQATLAKSLKNATGATNDQVASVETWISKTAAASGVADDKLRPALATLTRATGDVGKAQKSMGLAMDIAAATGKPLESVTTALAKGYGGSTGALGKLVPGLDKGVLATKDMAKISGELARLTGGASADAANTAEGQYKRMGVALDETQESIGGALLPALTAVAPILQSVAKFLQDNADVVGPLVIGLAGLAAVVWAVNAAMAANPVTLVALALGALVVAIVIAYNKCETFRNIVQAAWRGIAAAAMWAWNNVLKPVIGFIVAYVRAMVGAWRAAASGVAAAARAIGAAALWVWRNAIRPAINFIIGYFKFWWQAAVTTKDRVTDAFRAIWQTAVNLKKRVGDAIVALASAVMKPFQKVEDAIRGVIVWLQKLFDKITKFKLPKWLTSITGKLGSMVGLSAAPAYAPAPMVRGYGRSRDGSGRAAATPAAANTATAATMAGLTGAGTQVVVQVSDRRMVDLIDVQLRDTATATARALTRRQVVIV